MEFKKRGEAKGDRLALCAVVEFDWAVDVGVGAERRCFFRAVRGWKRGLVIEDAEAMSVSEW